MNYREAMVQADELRDNDATEEMKAGWLAELDGQIAEMMELDPPDSPWPEDGPLLMPAPHDRVYVLFLAAQIDYHNQESDLYQNDMVVYNASMDEARAWWRRTHRPKNRGRWKGVW